MGITNPGGGDVTKWKGSAPNDLVSSRVDASVGAIAANAVTATSIAAAALNGKGDWNVGKTGYTAAPTAGSIAAGSFASAALAGQITKSINYYRASVLSTSSVLTVTITQVVLAKSLVVLASTNIQGVSPTEITGLNLIGVTTAEISKANAAADGDVSFWVVEFQ